MASESKDLRRRFGDRGEDLAVVFFLSKGFEVIGRNWATRLGEIDLVCRRDGVTHFIEVKTRRSLMYGYPEEAVTPGKLKRLQRAVACYVRSESVRRYQIDVLAITALPEQKPEFHYIENVSNGD